MTELVIATILGVTILKHNPRRMAVAVLAFFSSQAPAATTGTAYFDFASFFSRYFTTATAVNSTTTTAATTTTTARLTTTSSATTTTARPTTMTAATTTTTTTTAITGAALPAAQTCGLSNFQQELVSRINQIRASARTCGSLTYAVAPALTWNTKLFNAAAGHSADMAAKNYFSHTSQDGRTFSQRITAAGYSWNYAGENIAAGQTTVDQVMNAWVNSPGHCANLMNKNFTEVGVACVRNDASTYRTYWTMDLARPY